MSRNSKLWNVIISETLDKHSGIHTEPDGNFTIVTVESGKYSTIGVTKRNPKDVDNEAIGYEVALFRACEKMMEKHPGAPLSKKLRKAVDVL